MFSPRCLLTNVRIPSFLLPHGKYDLTIGNLAVVDVLISAGRIEAIEPAGVIQASCEIIDQDFGLLFPRLVDIHTHLDKGHIWARRPNPDGTHYGARTSVADDRARNWSSDDVRARMEFSLRCAHAHGARAIRTHIDSLGPQAAISWPVFAEVREAWKGRIELQAAALFPIDLALNEEAQFLSIVDKVARNGGVLGGMTFLGDAPEERTRQALERVFDVAAANGLDLDFHVDESDLPQARSLGQIADVSIARKFKGRVVAGHCCSLALAPDAEAKDVIKRVADAGVAVVTLPMCNMYLQDRHPGKTPRWRGVAPVHELAEAGVAVMISSDNTRDPFYAYGDLDPVEVFREATRILQLDHREADWLHALSTTPASIMGLERKTGLEIGSSADFILFRTRNFNELNSRSQFDRTVVVGGQPIDARAPDYRELDSLCGFQA